MRLSAVGFGMAVLAVAVLGRTVDGRSDPPASNGLDLPHLTDSLFTTTNLGSLPGALSAVPVPEPANLNEFVKDRQAAIALGKALFWDMQVGSDGVQACASCHFRAGADPRSKNQVSPGLKHMPTPDTTFSLRPADGTPRGPNGQLQISDFPLTRLAAVGRGSLDPATDSNDAVSSQGIHRPQPDADTQGFAIGAVNTRRVEPGNTPSVINAVFNHRQFWDGRAENVFNGVNHLGDRDPNAKVFRADSLTSGVEVAVRLINSSLASQAVAPIVSDLEMAAPGRTRLDVGRELARNSRKIFKENIQNVRPLAKQQVHPDDSVLGPLSRWPDRGLAVPT